MNPTKGLLDVEEAFCELKSYLEVRPIHHRRPDRVVNHVRLCFLAYWLSARLGGEWRPKGVSEEVPRVLRHLQTIRLFPRPRRQIEITKVAIGSPADGISKVGDVILGFAGKVFSYDPRTELGKAQTVAESEAGAGYLVLTRWRGGNVWTKCPK